jgi:DNA repair protein RadC
MKDKQLRERFNLIYEYGTKDRPRVTGADNIYQEMTDIKDQKKEFCVLFLLDTRHKVVMREIVFIGTLDTSVIHPREILKSAIINSAQSFIISHNHPSGDPEPSREDITFTERLAKAGDIIGIPLLDHVIVGKSGYVSLRDRFPGKFGQ